MSHLGWGSGLKEVSKSLKNTSKGVSSVLDVIFVPIKILVQKKFAISKLEIYAAVLNEYRLTEVTVVHTCYYDFE